MFNKPATDAPYALHGERICDLGYSVIPCRPDSKRPGSYSGGQWYGRLDWSQYCDRAPTDFELRTWTRWPDAGLCVAMGYNDVIAIDVDTDNDTMRAALASVMPYSTVQKRGEKGFTAFYRGSRKIEPRHFDINKERIVDLLGYGTQTVCPPTIHPDTGRPYVWLTDDTLENTHPADLPELPDDIADQIAAALAPFGYMPPTPIRPMGDGFGAGIWRELNSQALGALDKWVPDLDLPKLSRNRRGGYVAVPVWRPSHRGRPTADRGANLKISPQGIRDFHDGEKGYTPVDLVMAAMGCSFEFAADWLKAKIGYEEPSLYGLEPWFPKSAAPVEAVEDTRPAPAPTVAAPRGTVDPFAPREAGGLLAAIAEFVRETGRRPVPEFAMMTAIAFTSALYGRKFITPTQGGLNVYMVGVAAPGFGKDHALKMLRLLAADSGMENLIGPSEVTSGSAMERVVRRAPSHVLPWDEIGVVLQSVTGRQASSWSQSIRKALLELYGLSTGVWTGKEHADLKRAEASPIYYPTVSLLGMTTPATFYKGLSEESLSDGFVARLTVIETKTRPARNEEPPLAVATPSLIGEIKKAAKDISAVGSFAPIADMKPKLRKVEWDSDEARKRWLAIEDWQNDAIDDGRSMDGVIGRAAEHAIKFATIRALSRSGPDAKVTVSDIEWGYSLVQRSLDCIEAGIRDHMYGSEFEQLTQTIKAHLRKMGSQQVAMSALLRVRGVSKHEKRVVMSAVERLAETGEIERVGRASMRLANAA